MSLKYPCFKRRARPAPPGFLGLDIADYNSLIELLLSDQDDLAKELFGCTDQHIAAITEIVRARVVTPAEEDRTLLRVVSHQARVPRGFGVDEFRRTLELLESGHGTRAKELFGLTDADLNNISDGSLSLGVPAKRKVRA